MLDEDNANFFTYPTKINIGTGIYITNDEFITTESSKEKIKSLKENEIIVLENSIMDVNRKELQIDSLHFDISQNKNFQIVDTYPIDFQLSLPSTEYIYNFFDNPYLNGYFVVDSTTEDTAYAITDFFVKHGYISNVIEYVNGTINIFDVFMNFFASPVHLLFLVLLILYILNSHITIDNFIEKINKDMFLRTQFGASFIQQMLQILWRATLPILLSNGFIATLVYLLTDFNHIRFILLASFFTNYVIVLTVTSVKFLLSKRRGVKCFD